MEHGETRRFSFDSDDGSRYMEKNFNFLFHWLHKCRG